MSPSISSKAFTRTPSHYIVPTRLLEARQVFSKHQKRMVALAMLAMQQERNRLYEIDPDGKDATSGMSATEKRQHYSNYIPNSKIMALANRYHTYKHDVLAQFYSGSASEVGRAIRRAAVSIPSKSIILVEDDESVEVMTPIPYAKYKNGVLTLGVLDMAVPYLMDHSLGYSSSELSIWCNLQSQHSQRLLELVSRHKERTGQRILISDYKRMFGVDYATYDDLNETKSSGKRLGDYKLVRNEETGKYERIPKYKVFKDFRRVVLDTPFQELISVSNGIWTATDDDGKGYRLHRKGKSFHEIELCLQYNNVESKVQSSTRKSTSKRYKKVKDVQPLKALIEQLETRILAGKNSDVDNQDLQFYEMLVLQSNHKVSNIIKTNIERIRDGEIGKALVERKGI